MSIYRPAYANMLEHYYFSDQMTHEVRSRAVERGFVESQFIELVTSAFLLGIRAYYFSDQMTASAPTA